MTISLVVNRMNTNFGIWFMVLLPLLFYLTVGSAKVISPIIKTSGGLVQGTDRTNFDGEQFYSFLSIPYGKPPVQNLRFKEPQRVDPWSGVRNASIQGNSCVEIASGNEDCLHLNVFTKTLPSEEQKLKPVMIFFPGGAFILGSNTVAKYGPDFLMTEDIVLVTIQYRLGLFGFLSLEDESLDIPGNAGLKDQVLALKWVQENIGNFNGDPKNVTIFGVSAGAASVEYLLLSPSAKGLFHKAIMESGSALNNWARQRFNSTDFATFLGLTDKSDEALLDALQNMSVSDLSIRQYLYLILHADHLFYGPVIEKPNPTSIITEHPIDIIQSGDYNSVPVIIGFNSNEGLLVELVDELGLPYPVNMYLPRDTNFNDPNEVANMIEILNKFYGKYSNSTVDKFKLPSDAHFVAGIIPSAINQARYSKNPVYLYRFSLDAGLNYFKVRTGLKDFPGACHSDEIGYLFTGALPLPTGEVEITGMRRMVKMWTNFAKFANPTPDGNDLNVIWKPIIENNINYLDIGEELVPSSNPEPERMKCWRELYKLNNVTAKFL